MNHLFRYNIQHLGDSHSDAMRHKAKVLMVVVTFCLVTQGSTQEEAECGVGGTKLAPPVQRTNSRRATTNKTSEGTRSVTTGGTTTVSELDPSMYLCKKVGFCRGFQPYSLQIKLRKFLINGETIWTKRENFSSSLQYWIPFKILKNYKIKLASLPTQEEKDKYKQRIRQTIDVILDRKIGLGNKFYICTKGTLAPPTTTRRATTTTTSRTTGVTTTSETPERTRSVTSGRTTTVTDASWDGVTLKIHYIELIVACGVFAFAILSAIIVFCCCFRKRNNREDASEASSKKSRRSRGSRRSRRSSMRSRRSQRSVVSRASKVSRKSRQLSSSSEESSSSEMSSDPKIKTRFDTFDTSPPPSEMSRQTKATIVSSLIKAAQTQKSIKDNISKGGNVVKKENIPKKKIAKSKYERV